VICRRLMDKGFDTDELFRLNWWQRSIAAVHPSMHKHCCVSANGTTFDIPPSNRWVKFKIIVSTSVAAGIIQHLMVPTIQRTIYNVYHDAMASLQFDLVVIDEVSQATEAEALVPIMCVKDTGIVVLAGDPEQLGPCPRTPVYHMSGMTQSLQQRLLRGRLYSAIQPRIDIQKDQSILGYLFDKLGVYLVHNYRSQKSILHVPSELFYGGVLMESGDRGALDSLGEWEELQGNRFAEECDDRLEVTEEEAVSRPFVVLFQAVDGQHKHDIDSPSFYNIDEIEAVVKLCTSLVHIHGERLNVTSRDIGVIGAFRSQVLKLRIALRECGLGGINVGGVEDYQGQETRIVIISTVLSQRVPTMEVNGNLGLVGDHRKFNVAVTRGMQLVIVVGQPYCLHTDPNWCQYMNYCDKHGGYAGFPCSLLASAQAKERSAEEMLNQLARASLLGGGRMDSQDGGTTEGNNMMGGISMYYSDNLEWRGML
jgi:superfamily I DNA and/or RNA helicase